MVNLFPTYEVGSLPKLNARVMASRGQTVADKDIEYIGYLSNRFSVDSSEVMRIFGRQKTQGGKLSLEERRKLAEFNSLLNVRIQEAVGLDNVYDGEAGRSEMYRHVASRVDGFENAPEMIRSREYDSWLMSICVGEPKLKENSLDDLILREFDFVIGHASKDVKVPIDDPYMIAVMSDNRHYLERLRARYENNPGELRYEAKREFVLALARNVIRPQVEAVANKGAKWVQLDMPALTLDVGHIPIAVEGINEVVRGIEGVKFSLHVCYPRRISLTDNNGYELLFPHVLNLNPNVNHFSLELANADKYEKDLEVFAKHSDKRRFEIGVGVIDITAEKQERGEIETPEIVRTRILKAADALRDPSLVYVAPDCGLRQLSLERCISLYEIMVEGTELARRG